jgi:multidrug resistance efflux pump
MRIAEIGHDVLRVDRHAGRIAELQGGVIAIDEPGLEAMIARNGAAGRSSLDMELVPALDTDQTFRPSRPARLAGTILEQPPEPRIATPPRASRTGETKRGGHKRRLRPAILLRILAAAGTIALVAWYLTGRLLMISSLEGVVSAPLVPLRAPIDGRVHIGEAIEPGGTVRAGQTLFTLADDQVDERALVDLRVRLASIEDAGQTIVNRIMALEGLRSTLRERTGLYQAATIQRLEAMLAEAKAANKGAQVQLGLSQIELRRSRDLAARAVQPAARLDESDAAARRSAFEVERSAASSARLQAELDSARRGVVVGEGFADAPYSLQRLDEIVMRLSDVAVERDALARSRRELMERSAAEERRLASLREAAVRSPATGLVWSLGVADGARVSRGDVLGELADCRHSYVEATLPERGFDSVRPGDAVRVRFSSSTKDIAGTVRSLRGAGAIESGARAAAIVRPGSGLMTVTVEVDAAAMAAQPAGACQLGRSAKVLF